MILGIDPGETTGIAFMNGDWKLTWTEERTVENAIGIFTVYAEQRDMIKTIVVEDYRLLQGKQMAQTGSRFETVQVIGAARLLARILSVPFVTQSPQILRLTEMHMHWPVHGPKSHIPDHESAQLHLLHFAETQGVPTTTLRELNPRILHL